MPPSDSEFDRALRYLFILALILIIVAYYLGSTQVLGTLGTNVALLGNTFTGRTSAGTFAGYPASGTTPGH